MDIDHVGIAVRSLDAALKPYATIGLQPEAREVVHAEGVTVAFLRVGGAHLELLEPLGPETVIARFLEKRGEGLHHVALAVEDVRAEIERARTGGLNVLDLEPRLGSRGRRVAFVHPKSMGGVLVEFVQNPH